MGVGETRELRPFTSANHSYISGAVHDPKSVPAGKKTVHFDGR